MKKTFRGLLTDGEQEKIRLSTKKGKIGYKIKDFVLFGNDPGVTGQESIMKLFKVTQSSVTGQVDFSDGNLLAASYIRGGGTYSWSESTIFEEEIFNQDIFITHAEESASNAPCNYYLVLEAFSMTDNAAAVSTLRDIRLNPQVPA